VAGVIAGFVVAERILEKRGYRRREKGVSISLDELPEHLRKRFLASCAVLRPDGNVMVGVDSTEVEKLLETLSSAGSDEIVMISGSDYKYVTKKGDTVVYVRGKFISMRDFSELWITVRRALRGVES